ncbi:MAG: SHOCT domain-containing protein [Phycisphaerales bacterium JB043]
MNQVLSVLVWSVALMAIVVVGGYVIMRVRRGLLQEEGEGSDSTMSLESLRQLRASGQISDEEFESLKRSLLASYGYTAEDAGGTEPGPETESS